MYDSRVVIYKHKMFANIGHWMSLYLSVYEVEAVLFDPYGTPVVDDVELGHCGQAVWRLMQERGCRTPLTDTAIWNENVSEKIILHGEAAGGEAELVEARGRSSRVNS